MLYLATMPIKGKLVNVFRFTGTQERIPPKVQSEIAFSGHPEDKQFIKNVKCKKNTILYFN